MKLRHVWPGLAPLILFSVGSVLPAEPTFEVDSKSAFVSIPFELDSSHLIFPIRIKETTFRVILDTGMPMSGLMLYGTEAVEKLDLEYGAGTVMIGGLPAVRTTDACLCGAMAAVGEPTVLIGG